MKDVDLLVIITAAAPLVKAALTRRAVKVLAVLLPVLATGWVVGLVLLGMLVGNVAAPAPTAPLGGGCAPVVAASQTKTTLTPEQLANAATVVAVGRQMGVPPAGHVVAIATAMQESTLRSLPYGDRDSLGLFQQRASWGTEAQRTDPAWAARRFYAGLQQVPGWQGMAVTDAAQAVQRSAFPDAYARWQGLASTIVGSPALATAACTGGSGLPTTRPGAEADLVAFGKELQTLGITVGEHPAFGSVSPTAHAPNSFHYRRGALDLNYDGHQVDEKTKLDTLIPLIKARGYRLIWQTEAHFDHQHIDVSGGPDMGNFTQPAVTNPSER